MEKQYRRELERGYCPFNCQLVLLAGRLVPILPQNKN